MAVPHPLSSATIVTHVTVNVDDKHIEADAQKDDRHHYRGDEQQNVDHRV